MREYLVILRLTFEGGSASTKNIVKAFDASAAFVQDYNRVVRLYKGKNIILTDIEVEEQ